MDTLIDVLLYLAAAVIPISIFVLVVRRSLRTERKWPQTAGLLGMTYTRHDDAPLERFSGFTALYTRGAGSLANVVSGNRAWIDVWLADYRYRTDPIGSVEPFGFTVCLLEDSRLDLPHFFIRSRSNPRLTTRAPLVLRPEDDPEVELGDDPEFSRAFSIRTGSLEEVRRLFTQELRDRLVALAVPFVEVEGLGPKLIVDQRRWQRPEDAGEFIDRAVAIAEELRRAKTGW